MNIPEEAVDAAAEFLFMDYSVTPYYRTQLRAALEAAAPHIRAVNPDVGPRCPECRAGLGTHDIRDPHCIDYRSSPDGP